jgi:carboxyl-terminal processing protease
LLILFLTVIGSSGCLGIPGRSQPLNDHQRDLYRESFQMVCDRIDTTFWDPDALGEKWAQSKDKHRASLEAASTAKEARKAMHGLLSDLNLSHFGIIPGSASKGLGEGGSAETGVVLRVADGRAVVVRIEGDSPAQHSGILPGEIVVAVGEKQLEPLIERWAADGNKYLPVQGMASTMQGSAGDTRTYTIEDADGNLRDVEITLETPNGTGKPVKFGHIGPIPLRLEKKLVEGGYLYLRFNMFLGPMQVMPWFQKALEEHADAPGLILDLRGNPGGLGLMACGIAGWLIEGDGFELGVMQLRDTKMRFVVNPRLDPWKKPVAVLVDEGSASTTEILAQGLQDLGVARIFGRTTAGAALPSMIVRLPCGDLLQYAIAGYHSRSGKRLEGAGVLPDEVIPVDPGKIRDEGDPILNAALRWFEGSTGVREETSR